MTPGSFIVRTSPHYERLSNKLAKSHRDFEPAEERAKEVLSEDPYNRARRNHIKKLEGVPAGGGQYRLSLGPLAVSIRRHGPGRGTALLRVAPGKHVLLNTKLN
jgi:hypothetical protein